MYNGKDLWSMIMLRENEVFKPPTKEMEKGSERRIRKNSQNDCDVAGEGRPIPVVCRVIK